MAPKSKEAIILTIDCGKSMSRKCFDSDKSVFDLSKQCLENIIRQKVFAETKNEYLLIEFSTYTSAGVKINGRLRNPNFELLAYISNRLQVSDKSQVTNDDTNVIEALNISINQGVAQMASQSFTGAKVALFTDFEHFTESDSKRFRSEVIPKLTKSGFQLIIISDFVPNSSHQLSKSRKLAAELMELIERSSLGFCYELKAAVKQFNEFEPKVVSSVPWYSNLQLGMGLNALNIPIAAYIKATPYQKKRAKTSFVGLDTTQMNVSNQIEINKSDKLLVTPTQIQTQNQSFITQNTAKDQIKIEIKEEVIRGYRYGQTIVPFSDEDKKMFDYDNKGKGMKIIGFTSFQNIDISLRVGNKTSYVFPDPRVKQNNHKKVFQALVGVMYQQKKVAIVRYTWSDRSAPQIIYLFPFIEDNNILLSYIQLPFAEDILKNRFPSLESKPNYCPTDKQLEVIDSLIDSMDLMTRDMDDDGDQCESLISTEISDPALQHWFYSLYYKQLTQNDNQLPTISDLLKNKIETPRQLTEKAVKPLIQILENFTLKNPKNKPTKTKSFSQSPNKRKRIDYELNESLDDN